MVKILTLKKSGSAWQWWLPGPHLCKMQLSGETFMTSVVKGCKSCQCLSSHMLTFSPGGIFYDGSKVSSSWMKQLQTRVWAAVSILHVTREPSPRSQALLSLAHKPWIAQWSEWTHRLRSKRSDLVCSRGPRSLMAGIWSWCGQLTRAEACSVRTQGHFILCGNSSLCTFCSLGCQTLLRMVHIRETCRVRNVPPQEG